MTNDKLSEALKIAHRVILEQAQGSGCIKGTLWAGEHTTLVELLEETLAEARRTPAETVGREAMTEDKCPHCAFVVTWDRSFGDYLKCPRCHEEWIYTPAETVSRAKIEGKVFDWVDLHRVKVSESAYNDLCAMIEALQLPAHQPVLTVEDGRAEFERWMRENRESPKLEKSEEGGYLNFGTVADWELWQSASSRPPVPSVAGVPSVETVREFKDWLNGQRIYLTDVAVQTIHAHLLAHQPDKCQKCLSNESLEGWPDPECKTCGGSGNKSQSDMGAVVELILDIKNRAKLMGEYTWEDYAKNIIESADKALAAIKAGVR